MLFGPWAESKPAHGDWIVELPEDEPRFLETQLFIVHGRFHSVPSACEMSFSRLDNIRILADK
jgi:hypothetical protein